MKPHAPTHHAYPAPRAGLENAPDARKEAWGRLAATGWKVFWLMVPLAGLLFVLLSGVIADGAELAPLLALLAHGCLVYLLLPLAAPVLTVMAFRARARAAVDPLRFVALLHSLLAAYVLLAVVLVCLVDLLK